MTKNTLRWTALLLVAVLGCGGKPATTVNPGLEMFDAEDLSGATAYFEGVLLKSPGDQEATYYLGRIAMKQDRYDDAIKQFETVTDKRGSSDDHYWLALAYVQKLQSIQRSGNFQEMGRLAGLVKDTAQKSVDLDSDNEDARELLGNFLLNAPPIAGGSVVAAKEQGDELMKRNPKRGHLFMAQVYIKEKKFKGAIMEYNQALELDPKDVHVHYRLAMTYQQMKEYDNAFAAFESALAQDANHMDSLYQLGRTSVFSGTNFDRAIECLHRYLETTPDDGKPSWSHAQWRLGLIYEKQGERALALAAYKKAIELDPTNTEAQKAHDLLKGFN